jgi:hypothetical protein
MLILHDNPSQAIASTDHGARDVYFSLLDDPESNLPKAREWLQYQLAAASDIPVDLPMELESLPTWVTRRAGEVGAEYKKYLATRKEGGPRRFFPNKAAALCFLKAAAPTKLVDGSWLYGMLPHYADPDYLPLIRTYLEELGDGVPDKNHVVVYRKLLDTHGCDHWDTLDDHYFVQGAIQLCLGHNPVAFLPEVIGYNLGYEQLPLHLLLTSYELNELGIDPYYFTLHVTIDNAVTGHGHKAVQAMRHLLPRVGDRKAFLRRMRDGYRLNDLGANTISVIASFDLEQELVGILASKSVVGKSMHSDYCRVAGKPVNEWLSEPAQIPSLLANLESTGWIRRGEPVENSRFWRLVQGDHAEMFGVFSQFELQVLRDWILSEPDGRSHRAQRRSAGELAVQSAADSGRPPRGLIRHRTHQVEFKTELHLLEEKVASLKSRDEVMKLLAGLMSPASHHTAVGLMATRMYAALLDS